MPRQMFRAPQQRGMHFVLCSDKMWYSGYIAKTKAKMAKMQALASDCYYLTKVQKKFNEKGFFKENHDHLPSIQSWIGDHIID